MADNEATMNVVEPKVEENAAPAPEAAAAEVTSAVKASEGEAEPVVSEATAGEGKESDESKNTGPVPPSVEPTTREPTLNVDAVDTSEPRLSRNSLPIRAYLDQTVVPVLLQVW